MKEIQITLVLMADRPEGTDDYSAAEKIVRQANSILQDHSSECGGAQLSEPTAETEINISDLDH